MIQIPFISTTAACLHCARIRLMPKLSYMVICFLYLKIRPRHGILPESPQIRHCSWLATTKHSHRLCTSVQDQTYRAEQSAAAQDRRKWNYAGRLSGSHSGSIFINRKNTEQNLHSSGSALYFNLFCQISNISLANCFSTRCFENIMIGF